jgi:D-serine dehydratase
MTPARLQGIHTAKYNMLVLKTHWHKNTYCSFTDRENWTEFNIGYNVTCARIKREMSKEELDSISTKKPVAVQLTFDGM